MASQGENGWSRREFLRGPTLAGTAVILGLTSESAAAEPPPETTRIRIHDAPITCFAPIYIAEELLKVEGFTDVQYIKTPLNEGPTKALAEGKIDITQNGTHTAGSERQDRSRPRTQQPSGLRRGSGHLRRAEPLEGHHLDQP
jgi:ABC-type nitrate/sulfonate/bicarbonate transport system substrate-binding protein